MKNLTTISDLAHYCADTDLTVAITPDGRVVISGPNPLGDRVETLNWLQVELSDYKRHEANNPGRVTAQDLLDAAAAHMEDRARTYDAPDGERSMGAAVSAFNAITGHQLTEEQGWLFQEVLKLVRSQQGAYRSDNYEDAVAYAALRGECAARERQPANDNQPGAPEMGVSRHG